MAPKPQRPHRLRALAFDIAEGIVERYRMHKTDSMDPDLKCSNTSPPITGSSGNLRRELTLRNPGLPRAVRKMTVRFTGTPILIREGTSQMVLHERLIYGILGDNLVLLPEDVANAAAADLGSICALKTYGEARRFEPQFYLVPGLDDEDYDEVQDDTAPYDATLTNEYSNGDWPASAATIALDHLPDDLADIGEQVEHFPNHPTQHIDPAIEAELVETLRQGGYDVRRDDALLTTIC